MEKEKNARRLLQSLHCIRRVRLDMQSPPEEADTSPESLQAPQVKSRAFTQFSGAIRIGMPVSDESLWLTRQAVNNRRTVFEGVFSVRDLEGVVDILIPVEDDLWDLLVVSLKSGLDDETVKNACFQHYLAVQATMNIRKVGVMHINPDYTVDSDTDLFTRIDVTDQVMASWELTPKLIEQQQRLLGDALQPPEISRTRCGDCRHLTTCESALGVDWPVHWLPRSHVLAPALLEEGVQDIRDIDGERLNGRFHKRVWEVTCLGRPWVAPEIHSILAELPWPRVSLDFESVAMCIPLWPGVKPYQHVPFQYSMHVQHRDGTRDHHEFLDLSLTDPRRELIEMLLYQLPATGRIIVFNASYEKRMLNELAEAFPEYREMLRALVERLWDLLPIVREYYYHPQQKGSWSLKAVSTCILEENGYATLNIKNGRDAQLAYLRHLLEQDNQAILDKLSDLSNYCKEDTLAPLQMIDKLSA